jgi:hypothetical protein
MPVSMTVLQAARNHFQTGMEQVAQQQASRLRAYATVKTGCTGKSQAHRKIQAIEFTDSTGRLLPTTGTEIGLEQRYLFPRKAVGVTLVDEDDAGELDLQVAPTGEIRMAHEMGAGRKIDDILIAGILGNNYEGLEDSMTTVALPAGQYVAVNYRRDGGSANTGLTLAKLVRAKGKFGKNEIYGQEQKQAGAKLCCAVSQDELDNLLYEVEQTGNSRYSDVKALVNGEVDYFMGIQFLRTERLPYTLPGGGKLIRSVPMWVSTGVHLDFWYDIQTKISERDDLSEAIQVRSKLKVGSCRKDEPYVAVIYCEQDV